MINDEKQGKRVEPNKSKLNKELLIHTYDSKKVSFLFFLLSPKNIKRIRQAGPSWEDDI